MALVLADRVQETTTTTGTTDFALGGAVTGFQTFLAGIGNTNTCYYTAVSSDSTQWEVGIGTVNGGGATLVRTTIIASSASGSKVSFSAGQKLVFVTYPAEKSVNKDADGNVVIEAASNTGAALRITQVGTGNALVVEDSANPDSTPFVVDSNGQVVINNTTAIQTGVVAGSPIVQVHGLTNNTTAIGLTNWSSTNSRLPSVNFNRSNGNTVGTRGALSVSGTSFGGISFTGDDGTNWIEAVRIEANVDGTPGTNDMPGRLVFSTTADGASSPTERMRINNAGRFGYNTSDLTVVNFRYAGSVSGSVSSYMHYSEPTIQSGVTTSSANYLSIPSTQAASFTLANLRHFMSSQGTIGAGSTVTNQVGFYAENNLTGATNNYGFLSNIASGTGRWNFYAAGSADNYFAGFVGIGAVNTGNVNLNIGRNLTGAIASRSVRSNVTALSDVTGAAYGYESYIGTQAAAFTLSNITHFYAEQNTIGAGSTVTNQHGYYAYSNLTGATNNYGFYSNIASGTGRWNFYAAGSADNYFAGSVGVGATPSAYGKFIVSDGTVIFAVNPYGANNTCYVGAGTNSNLALLTNNTERMRIDSNGNLIQSAPTTAPTLSTNGTMVFNLTSDTNLRVSVRGSDGVTRTANITLA